MLPMKEFEDRMKIAYLTFLRLTILVIENHSFKPSDISMKNM